jgi:hypothetical protein
MATKKIRAKKFFITALNERLPDNLQFNIITLLNDDLRLLTNQYAKVFTLGNLGEYDITAEESSAILSFFPIDNRPNDYTYAFSSFSFFQGEPTGEFVNEFLGDLVRVGSFSTTRTANFSKIIEIPFDFSSSKIEIQSSINNNYQFDEINLTHNGDNAGIGSTIISNVKYGTIFSGELTEESSVGLGTYFSYIQDDKVFIDFIPSVVVDTEINFTASLVSIANTNFSTEGNKSIRNISLTSRKTVIPKNEETNEVSTTVVGSHGFEYQASYYIAQCTDLNNNHTQVSEIVVINSRTQSYLIEYGSIFTKDRIGTFSSLKTLDTELLFTPIENIDVDVVVFQVKISSSSEFPDLSTLNLDNLEIESGLNRSGVDGNFILNFYLRHKGAPVFERLFNGSSPDIVNLSDNTILLPNHFFVTGENVRYISDENDETSNLNSITIEPTTVPGIGVTNKLPNDLYIIRVDSTKIKLAKSAEDALKILPQSFNFTGLGIGLVHNIVATQQNSKSLISIDNIIQSPIRFTDNTTILSKDIDFGDFSIIVNNEKLFAFDDIIKINDEIMRVSSVGIGSTNSLIVIRNSLGTERQQHFAGSIVRKYKGNYNISNNRIYFTSPPYGLTPFPNTEDPFDEKDYSGIQTKSSFDGRIFLRSGIPLSVNKSYTGNHVFDNLNEQFDGITDEFILKENNDAISGISTDNGLILLNNIYQSPKGNTFPVTSGYYQLEEDEGNTKIKFIGDPIQNLSDINTSRIPYGGVIVSVGSTDGFGYQPLVSAGGTAVVSTAGTISQISIGNSGSGYRVGIQTQINVGVVTYSSGIPNIEIVGIASVIDGNVIGVAITNAGIGYTFTDPPEVVFDSPLGYVSLPLIYSNQSQSGIGTGAIIDIVVGKGNNVIDFNITNFGYGYKVGDILTIPTNIDLGVPTFSNISFSEFQIFVDETYSIDFSGWSMGQFEVFDNLDSKFNGRNKNFQISFEGKPISISKRTGSPIDLQYVLLIFINDVLQIPFKNYTFTGSIIKFNEAPKGSSIDPPFSGDTSKIIFYKGTSDIDVDFVEILDSPKIGDLLTIKSDNKQLSQKSRIIETISSIDTADTNTYSDFGISENENLLRPVKWCKQTEDLYIFGKEVTKDRRIYNPYINPISYLIKNISIDDSEIFVDSARLFFDYPKENISEKESSIIEIIANSENVGEFETISNVQNIEGDFGIIVGIGSTSIAGISNTCLIFDLFIPIDSYLRDNELNSSISNEGISGIQTGYRFVVSGFSTGNSNTSFDMNGNPVSIGSSFLDNIYECIDFSNEISFLAGIGFTNVTKVTTAVNYFDGIEFVNPLGFIEDFNFVGGTEITARSNQIYNNVSASGGVGINATFNIERDNIGQVSNVFVNNGGIGYNTGDILTIPGDSIGGGGQIDSFNFVGSTIDFGDTYIEVGGTTTGSGFDALFDIVRDNFGEIESVSISNKGSNYIQSDIITILGSNVGGINTDDDITITVENIEIKTIDSIMSGIGSEGSYIGVGGTTSGSGINAEFDIVIDEFGQLESIQISNLGLNYQINDNIIISGDSIGGGGSIDSLTFTATTVGTAATYTGVTGTTSGDGIGAEFNIERDASGEIIDISVVEPGRRYAIADTITILGSDVGGTDTTDDVIITVTEIVDNDQIIITITSTQINSFNFVGSTIDFSETYTGVGGTTSGFGFDAQFEVERGSFGQLTSVSLLNKGFVYDINDTITILGTDVGGVNSDDDIVITITNIVDDDFILVDINEISTPDKFIFGKYTWGKITTPFRSSPKSFNINLPSVSGIGTNPIIRRKNPLKRDLYLL